MQRSGKVPPAGFSATAHFGYGSREGLLRAEYLYHGQMEGLRFACGEVCLRISRLQGKERCCVGVGVGVGAGAGAGAGEGGGKVRQRQAN